MAQLNFADYDFDKLVVQLQALVKAEDAWKDITVESGTGKFLIDLFSYVSEMLMYYLERRAQESYIDTAQLRSSVVRLVDLIGYIPKRQVSSSGTLRFSVSPAYAKDIYIPRGAVILTSDLTKFYVSDDAILVWGNLTVDVPGIQGVLTTGVQASTGVADQEISLSNVNIENSRIRVTVDGALWLLQDNFVNSNSDSKDYVQKTELDGTVTLIFGDGKFGKIPTIGASIAVEYVITGGLDGNVYSTGQIVSIESTLYDSDGTDVSSLVSVTNTTTFLGGDAAEDKEEIRREAPAVFKTGDRAVTREDYTTIIDNIAGVASSYVWGERDVVADYASADITMFNKLKIVCLLQEWEAPNAAFKALIKEALEDKEQLTVWLEFVDPNIVDTVADLDLKVLAAYQPSQVTAAITDELADQMALGVVNLGVSVRKSDVIHALEGVTGVDYIHLTFKQRELLGTGDGGVTHFADIMTLPPLKKETVQIYKDATLIATDNGSGVFSVPGVLTGTVTYATGDVSVDFVVPPALGEDVYSYYQQDEDGDIIVGNQDIAKLVETNITVL